MNHLPILCREESCHFGFPLLKYLANPQTLRGCNDRDKPYFVRFTVATRYEIFQALAEINRILKYGGKSGWTTDDVA